MPLVFVHGVSNRMRQGYQEGVDARNALFRRFTLAALTEAPDYAVIKNPFWGGQGASFRWGLASLPGEDGVESLGPADADPQMTTLAAATAARAGTEASPGNVLLAAARDDFPATVDLVFAAGSVTVGDNWAAFAELSERAAAYTKAHREPPWLSQIGDDKALLDRLQEEIATEVIAGAAAGASGSDYEALGISDIWGAVCEGADRLRVAAGDALGTNLYGLVRRHVVPSVATFVGDVMEYLSHRGTPKEPEEPKKQKEPGPIVQILADCLWQARGAIDKEKDPYLVVVGHSLGGVILYDLLSAFEPTLRVDALVTVGSQVGLFEELKLFLASDPAVPGGGVTKLTRPTNIDHWINIYDNNDVLSYKLEPLFDDVHEFRYATGELLTAHGAYFGQPRFHQLLAERLKLLLAP